MQRADFDDLLARNAARAGAELRFGHEVTAIDVSAAMPQVSVRTEAGETYEVEARYLLDASGFGRILPRLLDLETPSGFPVRAALFTPCR